MKRQNFLFSAWLLVLILGPWVCFAQDSECSDLLTDRPAQIEQLIESYTRFLAPYEDPFAIVFSPEQGNNIFQELLVREEDDGQIAPSSLSLINETIKSHYAGQAEYDGKVIQSVIEDARFALENSSEHRRSEMQGRLLALKYSQEYLRRFRPPYSEESSSSDSPAQPPKEQDQEEKSKDQKQVKEEYPEISEQYNPETEDTEQSGDKNQKPFKVAEVNFKTPYFGQRRFAMVVRGRQNAFQQIVLPSKSQRPGKHKKSSIELIIYPYGKMDLQLSLPPGKKPLQPSDSRTTVVADQSGTYRLLLKEQMDEVRIPLVDADKIVMLDHVKELYQRPVGFKDSEWPSLIRAEILNKFSKEDAKDNPLGVAKALADHIATQYLYSVGAREEKDPIDALNAGAFQCSMASYIMVAILRDFYNIPSQVVAGYRAKEKKDDIDSKSYLVLPGDGHAWVEVFQNGKWHTFDPTPLKKDRKKNEEKNDPQEYQDISTDNDPPSDKEKNEILEEESELVENQDEENEFLDLADQLEMGSIEMDPKPERNALLDRAMRILMRKVLDPTSHGSVISNKLNQILSLANRFPSSQLKELVQRSLTIHEKDHPDLKNWIEEIARLMPERTVNETYQEVFKVRSALELYSKTLDPSGKIPVPTALLQSLAQVEFQLQTMAHKDSKDIVLVNDMVSELSSVSRSLLEQRYGLTSVGPNAPTRAIAEAIKSGDMADLRLMALLAPVSDFILNSTPRPEFQEVKAWFENPRVRMGKDIMPFSRFSDMSRSLLGQPGKSLEQNINEGSAFVLTNRQRVLVPFGQGKGEAERITVILYDTSGSMSGKPGRFQAGLISTFVDRALSDVSPSGRHRHKVLIIPFDDSPGEALAVTNAAEALEVIRNYKDTLKNTGKSTNIEAALIQAMSLIADAEKRSGEPLAAANIILMTDGEDEVDTETLLKEKEKMKRGKINESTPLQTMFVAINNTNRKLIQFANESQAMGMEKGFYREFSGPLISKMLDTADNPEVDQDGGFYTEQSAKSIPADVSRWMDQAMLLASKYAALIHQGSRFVPSKEHLRELEKLKWRDAAKVDRPLESWLIKMRIFATSPVFKDRHLLEAVIDDMLVHFEKISGVSKESLVGQEQEHLRHLIRYAAGLEEAQW